ncbi:Universal stress protein A domain-containing protein [Desulfonema limicola]|uniref:Universal stress protein A domain-containing protein n=1 Tax=Desulfonema limicola TaxID=45656 RepID=A0A975BBD8_9BACT|nr:universal stress protein [Desulfonema limicola]QTA82165.1 Universal stress protein A domain-containing protein [Desulfonema limicola]
MFKPISSILFATNLAENCKPAFDFAVSLAAKYQAVIILLHVIEKMPDYAERRLVGLLGQKHWEEITKNHENDARAALIGKKSSSSLIRKALEEFCSEAGIDDSSCGYHSREVVVKDGEIVDEIISLSKEYHADMIIMGARKGFLKDNKIGSHIKEVMRKTKIPVLVVPPYPLEKAS